MRDTNSARAAWTTFRVTTTPTPPPIVKTASTMKTAQAIYVVLLPSVVEIPTINFSFIRSCQKYKPPKRPLIALPIDCRRGHYRRPTAPTDSEEALLVLPWQTHTCDDMRLIPKVPRLPFFSILYVGSDVEAAGVVSGS